MMTFDYYVREDGTCPFEEWANRLPSKDRNKLLATIQKASECGLAIALQQQWIKKLDKVIWEVRSAFGSNIQRVLFFKENREETYLITHGFTKKSQKTPRAEITRAHHIRHLFEKEATNANKKL